MRISDWSSDVCSSDLQRYRQELIAEAHHRLVGPLYTLVFALIGVAALLAGEFNRRGQAKRVLVAVISVAALEGISLALHDLATRNPIAVPAMYIAVFLAAGASLRSEEHTSELQSLMRIS